MPKELVEIQMSRDDAKYLLRLLESRQNSLWSSIIKELSSKVISIDEPPASKNESLQR
jgi:hypothetical protein